MENNQYKEVQERLVQMFQSHEATLNGLRTQPLQQLRKKALDKMDETPFPSRKNENWKYTAVSPIVKPDYVSLSEVNGQVAHRTALTERDQSITIPVINGRPQFSSDFQSSLPTGLTILPLEKAMEKEQFASFIIGKLNSIIDQPKNTFELMNIAFAQNGIFIHTDKNVTIDRSIVFHYSNEHNGAAYFTHPQIIVKAEQGSQFNFIESFGEESNEQVALTNALHIIDVAKNAKVLQYKFQNEAVGVHHIYQLHAHQDTDSHFHSYQLDLGGHIVRNNLSTHLEGQNTTTHLLGNYIANGRQSMDNQTFIDHALPHCFSNELYKGIVTDRAKAVFNGQVLVRQDAQKTNAFQQNASLVLSPHAVVDAKPQLEIYADDVKCSHGATIGQLDNESIFYLRSRGLTEQAAREMLQLAFVNEVVDHIEDDNLGAIAREMIENKLAEKTNV